MKKLVVYFLLIGLITIVFGCGSNHKYSETKILMGTFVRIDVCPQYDDSLVLKTYAKAWNRLEDISSNMSVFEENSDVSKINKAYPESVRVESDLFKVIQKSIEYSQRTLGAFDITVKPLITLWKIAERKNIIPSINEIRKVKARIGYQNILLSTENEVKLLASGVEIDLGGVAKGYAADEAARIFRGEGIKNFFVDAGGDIYASGLNCQGEKWKIGVKDPQSQGQIMDIIHVSDVAVTTSGNYEQFFEVEGARWSHIIDPRSGYPQKGVISATVIAPSAMEADALSTAMTVLGEEGIQLLDQMGGDYAGLIMEETETGSRTLQTQTYKNTYSKR